MCGIVGVVGKPARDIILNGLTNLEYRGYDSAGIYLNDLNGHEYLTKAVGRISNLKEKLTPDEQGLVGIGHTRWATHGKPTVDNAHPHLGEYSFVIHNGIIENYKELKSELENSGVRFVSQTDTEVIVHLFEFYNKSASSPFEAYEKTISRLQGAYATLLITKAAPNDLF